MSDQHRMLESLDHSEGSLEDVIRSELGPAIRAHTVNLMLATLGAMICTGVVMLAAVHFA